MNNTTLTYTVSTFATGMRAASLIEDLTKAGIKAIAIQPKWTNKRLPPPRIEVKVAESDVPTAAKILAEFKNER